MSLYSTDEQFVIALKKRDWERAQKLLDLGANINYKNIRGETPVFFFSESHSLDILEWLIKHNADVDISNDIGDTPLFSAIQKNDLNAVDALIKGGADVNKPNTRKVYPLMQAVLVEKDFGVLERLLEAKPDLDLVSESRTTPLMAAAAHKKNKYVGLLLDAGANPNVINYLGQGLLHAAILSQDPSMVKLVAKKAPNLDPNLASRSGTTPMSLSLGFPEMTKTLLDMGGNPNAKVINRMYNNMNLLMASIGNLAPSIPIKGVNKEDIEQDTSLVDELIAKGADVMHRTDNGSNVGYFLLNTGAFNYFPKLIHEGLDTKQPLDVNSSLPYDLLASPQIDRDNNEVLNTIEELYNMGFPFSRPKWNEEEVGVFTQEHEKELNGLLNTTVLSQFVSSNYWEAVQKCLELGADINESFDSGNNLVHLLVNKQFNGLSEQQKQGLEIASKAKNINQENLDEQLQEIKDSAKETYNFVTELLEKYHIDWNKQNNDDNTPLHLACAQNNMEWSKFLLCDKSVDPTYKNKEGLTPAGEALKHGHVELYYALSELSKQKGYDLQSSVLLDTVLSSEENFMDRLPWLNAVSALDWTDKQKQFKNEDGQDALYLAAATDQHDTVRTLLKMGFNPNTQDKQGNTPLMQAVFNENGEIIRLLRAAGAKVNLKNNCGQTALDVADYVKSSYVHKVLESNDLDELCSDLLNKPPTKEEKQNKKLFKEKLKNLMNDWSLNKNYKKSKLKP